jgi:excinuclease ABC A subunit
MANKIVTVTGACIHNLKNIDIAFPKGRLTVITGVSGSGKSSLAFDTLYEEGKRRYLMFSDTQFKVDHVPAFKAMKGLSPTLAVEQRVIRQSNPRSTVGTRTKISAMLAALFAAYGRCDSVYDDGWPLTIEMFQKNSPKGMCVRCLGKGTQRSLDESRMFETPDQKLYRVFGLDLGYRGITRKMLDTFCRLQNLSVNQPVSTLTPSQLNILKYGDGGKTFRGYLPWIEEICNGAFSSSGRLNRLLIQGGYIKTDPCTKCNGSGLGERASRTVIDGKTITQLEQLYISDLGIFLKQLQLPDTKLTEEILQKLECLSDIGLYHLALARPVPTLSGGELQRLFLASYLIAEMDSIIFIFDEPTIGLHEAEKQRLIKIIRDLIMHGNTVVAVEHDMNFIKAADYIIDLGPGAGVYGGERVFQGRYHDFIRNEHSETALYLSGKRSMPVKREYRPVDPANMLSLTHCTLHNLRDLSVKIPLGLVVGVAGVSGSGKSSLIADTLVPKLREALKSKWVQDPDDEFDCIASNAGIAGFEHIRQCILIDQKPIGRSRTSCPATYTGIWDRVRMMFAQTHESIARGFNPGMFSQNAKGKCLACGGDGARHYHIGFGNFIDADCETCGGTGFSAEAMAVTMDGKSIRDILEMDISSARSFFLHKDKVCHRILTTMEDVGLGYMLLGQKTPTISGGEAQRIKLAKALGKEAGIKAPLYILDEPTTGLSFSDIEKLIGLVEAIADRGSTVIITEHDPYVLSNCDYLIEMGPGGGHDGGAVIAAGTPESIKSHPDSILGRYLQ